MKKTARFITLLLIKILLIILLPFIFLGAIVAVPVASLFLWIVEDIKIDAKEMCKDILGISLVPIRDFFNF